MQNIILVLLAIALLGAVFKVAIILLVLAGLIFRTKETVGLLMIGALWAGFKAQPLIGIGLIVLALAISLFFKRKEKKLASRALPAPDD